MKLKHLFSCLALCQLFFTSLSASAQGTAFSYQGHLQNNGVPANGSFDLTFTLFDASINGNTVAGPITNSATAVSNGLFTATLDFGAGVFTGSNYWLQIGARTNGNVNPYVMLAPLQPVTPAPYAIFAPNAGTAQTAASADSIAATNISGTIALAQLPPTVVTNNATGMNLTGTFSGDGAGVTNINLASVNSSGTIAATALPSGNFVRSAFLGTGLGPNSVVAADVNGDGKLDLICANNGPNNQNGNLTVLTNDGAGNFALSASLGVGVAPTSVAAADVNGDGKVDLISANQNDSTLTVLTNTGTGQFIFSALLSVGSFPHCVIATDINGDSKVDLISANSGGNSLTVLTNDGSGHFAVSASPGAGSGTFGVTAADVNGDGKADLISANFSGNSLTVLTNDGTGHFVLSASPGVGFGPGSVTAADVNGDGKVDLISVNMSVSSLSVLINDGAGHFALSSTLGAGPTPYSVAAADVNGDGQVDLICADSGSTILTVLTNNGTGHFGLFNTFDVGEAPVSVVATNVNGDGLVDLICANHNANTLTVLTNTPRFIYAYNGSFSGNGTGLTSLNASQITSGTVPLARLPTAVVTNTENGVTLGGSFAGSFSGSSTGTFTGNGSGLTNLNASQLTTGTVPTAQLPANIITSSATLTNLTVSGTVTASNINTAAGTLTVNSNIIANGTVYGGMFISTGPNAELNIYDRGGVATYGQWSFYALNGKASFWQSGIGDRMSIDNTGNVRAVGSFLASTTPDLAETIPAADNVEAGDIVCADPLRRESVIRCGKDNQGILGVISDGTSGFIINANGKSVDAPLTGKPLVLAGRVPVKVSLENGPVHIGDTLAPSSIPGIAMRSTGTGSTIGIALDNFTAENLSRGTQTGTVLCFVKAHEGTSTNAVQQMRQLLSERDTRIETLEKTVAELKAAISKLSTSPQAGTSFAP
ncbi:FG-GAP-like repeat-containing protein [Pedosphaera parvula]|uniref:FG-GAP repeat protein n=1 Tax=Pedosphaera parvula (strain Ellin514) TaxID=320771 RepID=B9XQM1_PEDPL|nr:FG-GAP-like repeat-containing protein [Pedosphaera parvula]EEF57871.1 FG-GAP repeat protein [Pedosphaera parvula Ellin514]